MRDLDLRPIPKTVTVKGSWMAACGRADVDTTVDVTGLKATAPNGERYYDVTLPDGRPWTVCEYRLVK